MPVAGACHAGLSLRLAVLICTLVLRTATRRYFLEINVMNFSLPMATPPAFVVCLFFDFKLLTLSPR